MPVLFTGGYYRKPPKAIAYPKAKPVKFKAKVVEVAIALEKRTARNHINFHHAHYSKDHLVSRTYLGDEGNNTPFFFIPVFLVGACTYLVLPVALFVAQLVACAASFYAHVLFDKGYHIEGSRLQRFAWFRRKQELHFVHHRHANSNFAVIHFFWDRISVSNGGNLPKPPVRRVPFA